MVIRTAHCFLTAKSRMDSTILMAVKASRPLVGSSRNSNLGCVINSTPMVTRFLSPPNLQLRFGMNDQSFASTYRKYRAFRCRRS